MRLLVRDPAKVSTSPHPSCGHRRIGDAATGDIVVLAVPYSAVPEVLSTYAGAWDAEPWSTHQPGRHGDLRRLVVPGDSSAAQEFQASTPAVRVVKAFNTNFAATLATGAVRSAPTTVLIAGDDDSAKHAVADLVRGAGLRAADAGSLSAHESSKPSRSSR